MELKNKTAIITGAGKGIGRAIAEALAKEGVHLGLIARTASDLQALQQSLSQEYGVKQKFLSHRILTQRLLQSLRSEAVRAISPRCTPSLASASAIARPIPLPAPVMIAVLFLSSMWVIPP